MTAQPFLRGAFETFALDEMLGVLSLSRQPFGVRFSDADGDVGAISIKAGRVIEAEDFRARTNGVEAFRGLVGNPGTEFQVVELAREAPETRAATPIGSLADLLADRDLAQAADPGEKREERRPEGSGSAESRGGVVKLIADAREAPTTSSSSPPESVAPVIGLPDERTLLMQGRFSDFSLEALIGTLEFCRQTIELQFLQGAKVLHRVVARSGRITAAVSASAEGADAALAAIREHPGSRFLVFRRREATAGQPIASMRALFSGIDADAISADPPPDRVRSGEPAIVPGSERPATQDDLAGIEAQLERFAADVAALQTALNASRQSPARSEVRAVRGDLSGIGKRLERVAAEVTALRSAMKALRQETNRARLAVAVSAVVEAKLLPPLEHALANVTEELRSALGSVEPAGRRQRTLLWCVLAAQLGTLAAVVGAVVLLM